MKEIYGIQEPDQEDCVEERGLRVNRKRRGERKTRFSPTAVPCVSVGMPKCQAISNSNRLAFRVGLGIESLPHFTSLL